jgi:hypothetical protein
MGKHALLVRLPIISSGALVGCAAELLRLPLGVAATMVIGSQILLTSLWVWSKH